jgi:hypothetical protein
MKLICVLLLMLGLGTSRASEDDELLLLILSHYYKNEKTVVKGRNQHLFTFCEKPNNNEEIFETINALKLPAKEVKAIKGQVALDVTPATWTTSLALAAQDHPNLYKKINDCLLLDQFLEKQKKSAVYNQRLMIASKPVYYNNQNRALVKVVFYRSIEHNSGSILHFEKTDKGWVIKEFLNSWST